MASIKFSSYEMDQFKSMKDCLNHPQCCQILEKYIKDKKRPSLRTFNMWKEIRNPLRSPEEFFDDIEDIDGFNLNPLFSLNEPQHQRRFIEEECCRLLNDIFQPFRVYLNNNHRA